MGSMIRLGSAESLFLAQREGPVTIWGRTAGSQIGHPPDMR